MQVLFLWDILSLGVLLYFNSRAIPGAYYDRPLIDWIFYAVGGGARLFTFALMALYDYKKDYRYVHFCASFLKNLLMCYAVTVIIILVCTNSDFIKDDFV